MVNYVSFFEFLRDVLYGNAQLDHQHLSLIHIWHGGVAALAPAADDGGTALTCLEGHALGLDECARADLHLSLIHISPPARPSTTTTTIANTIGFILSIPLS